MLPFWLSFSLYQVERSMIKKSVKNMLMEKLNDSDLVLLKFKKEEINSKLEWEHSREFEFNQKMYDVIKTEYSADSVFYLCWLDKDETALNKRLFTLLINSLEKNNKTSKTFGQLISSFSNYYLIQQSFYLNINSKRIEKYLVSYINQYESLNFSPNYPPPKV